MLKPLDLVRGLHVEHREIESPPIREFNQIAFVADILNVNALIMALKLKPLGARVLVEPVAEQEPKRGGIIIPDTAKEKPTEAIVRAVGPGEIDEKGNRIPLDVKEGDRVLISKSGGTEIKLDNKEYKVLGKDDILAVVE